MNDLKSKIREWDTKIESILVDIYKLRADNGVAIDVMAYDLIDGYKKTVKDVERYYFSVEQDEEDE